MTATRRSRSLSDPPKSDVRQQWVFFAVDAKLSSIRKALPYRMSPQEQVLVVNREVSLVRAPTRWRLNSRRNGIEYSPLHLPERIPGAVGVMKRANARLIRADLDRLLGRGPRYVCYDSPEQYAMVGRLGESLSIYLVADDYTITMTGEAIKGEEAAERRLLPRVDLILCVSECLAGVIKSRMPGGRHNRVHVLENGYDEFLFDPAKSYPEPAALAGIPHPRCLVAGHISDRIDWEGIAACRRLTPELQWVFLGPVAGSGLERVQQVSGHFRPPVELAAMPCWMSHCDLGAVPYCLNRFTNASGPVKAIEYLGMGMPTLSTRNPFLLKLADSLAFVTEGDGSSYAFAVKNLLSEVGDPKRAIARQAAVARYRLAHRLEEFRRFVALAAGNGHGCSPG